MDDILMLVVFDRDCAPRVRTPIAKRQAEQGLSVSAPQANAYRSRRMKRLPVWKMDANHLAVISRRLVRPVENCDQKGSSFPHVVASQAKSRETSS
jgi:hypothetical protein